MKTKLCVSSEHIKPHVRGHKRFGAGLDANAVNDSISNPFELQDSFRRGKRVRSTVLRFTNFSRVVLTHSDSLLRSSASLCGVHIVVAQPVFVGLVWFCRSGGQGASILLLNPPHDGCRGWGSGDMLSHQCLSQILEKEASLLELPSVPLWVQCHPNDKGVVC